MKFCNRVRVPAPGRSRGSATKQHSEEAPITRPRLAGTWLLGVVVALLLIGMAPTAAQVRLDSTMLPDTSIAVEAEGVSDGAIAERIRAVLAALDGYDTVEVEVESGVVTISGTAVDEAAVLRLEQIVRRVDGVVAVNGRVSASTDLPQRLGLIQQRFQARLWQILSYLPLLGVALVVFLLISGVGFALSRVEAIWNRAAPNSFLAGIYAQISQILFILVGLVVALDLLGATAVLGSILGAAGIIGLAIGIAVRDSVENFVASVMLSIRQPFEPFDLVEVDGDVGKVVRLTSRATVLLSPDGNLIRVPNSTVFKKRLLNYSRNPERRFTFKLDVDPTADIAKLRATLEAKLGSLPFVLDEPAAHVVVQEDTGEAVRLGFAAWIDQRKNNWEQSRGEAIRVLRAEARPAACQADLAVDSLADLSNTEERHLERMVEAERQVPRTSDLLTMDAPKE